MDGWRHLVSSVHPREPERREIRYIEYRIIKHVQIVYL